MCNWIGSGPPATITKLHSRLASLLGSARSPWLLCISWLNQTKMTAPQPVLLLCPVRKNRHHVCQQPRNQVILLAKLTCLAGKRSETRCQNDFSSSSILHISHDKGLSSSSVSHPLALLECPLFGTWGLLGSLPRSLGFRKPQDAYFKKDHVGDGGLVSSPP